MHAKTGARKQQLIDHGPTSKAVKYHDSREQQKVNQLQNNFHGANAVHSISTALDNLATAATTNPNIVSQLTESNKQLTKTNKRLIEQLKRFIEANNILSKKVGNQKLSPAPAQAPSGGQPPFDQKAWEANLDPTGYCWTHGYHVQKGHTIVNCNGKFGGQKNDAT
jgi:hypothetical protein